MTKAEMFAAELEAEAPASRKCLERMKPELNDWKPHEKSMAMGYLALLVADMPRWLSYAIEKGEVDFQTYPRFEPTSADLLVKHFDEAVLGAIKALSDVTEETFDKPFTLRNGDHVLMTSTVGETVGSTLNHWVHHRGQLTVYMRQNDIPVPSIYGPSADDKTF